MTESRELQGCWVLVAEDQYLVAEAMREAVEELGGRVLGPVASVADALAAIGEHRPDLAVLDVDLNGERVYPVADRLARDGVPFAFTTGFDRGGMSARFAGTPCLTKPIRFATLARTLRELGRAAAGTASGSAPLTTVD